MTRQLFSFIFFTVLITALACMPAGATVLWDNGPLVNCQGCGDSGADESQVQTALGLISTGFPHDVADDDLLADDFTVDGGVWDVTRIAVFAYLVNGTPLSQITDLRFQILDGPPDNPASSVVYGSLLNSLTGSDWTGIYRVRDSASGNTTRPVMRVYTELAPGTLYLAPGTYWLAWQTGHVAALSGPWAPPISIDGQTVTGNAKFFYLGVWQEATDGAIPGNPQQGFPFVIEGSKVANFNLSTGIVNIPVVTIDGSSKRYQVEMERTPGTLDFTVTDSNKIP